MWPGRGLGQHGGIPIRRAWHPAQATSIGVIKLTANQYGPWGGGALRSPTWTGPRTLQGAGVAAGCRCIAGEDFGVVQFAPSGSRCSVTTGTGITRARRVQLRACASSRPAPSALRPLAALAPGSPPAGGGQGDGLLERVPAAQAGRPAWRSADVCRSVLPGRAGLGCRPCWREYVNQGSVMRSAGIRARFAGWPMPGSDRGLARQILEGGPMRWAGRA